MPVRNIIKRGSVIYFLILKKKIIYIGASKAFPNRLAAHYWRKYDYVRFIYVPEKLLKYYEARLIRYFKPKGNLLRYKDSRHFKRPTES